MGCADAGGRQEEARMNTYGATGHAHTMYLPFNFLMQKNNLRNLL